MKVYLIDGTYELFRHYYALPKHITARGEEVGAVRGVLTSVLSLLNSGVTHIAVATDHVIESFRNILWSDYKDSTGVAPDLLSQFPLLEESLRGMGVLVWAMVEYEADDALAAGAALYRDKVEQVLICTPDKDLGQCVVGDQVVQFDRRQRKLINEKGVIEKFGVLPESIPDYLALVGDAADGYPGLPGWGAKAASAVLARYKHLEEIPDNPRDWKISIRSADRLASTLREQRELVLLFRQLATLVTKGPVKDKLENLEWSGPSPQFREICSRLEAPELPGRVNQLASIRASRK
ncbi:flap endonuclease [bacterium]|nr:flap endonuclease [bacterium]MCI0601981.1 flap endonuclease [bacterium]